jgi:hypothetical protein
LTESSEHAKPSRDSICEVFTAVESNEKKRDNIEEEADKSEGIGSNGLRGKFERKVGKRTHNVSVDYGVALAFILVNLDSFLTFSGNVVFEKLSTH